MEKIMATVIMLGVVMGLFVGVILPNNEKALQAGEANNDQINNITNASKGGISGDGIIDLTYTIADEEIKDTNPGDGTNDIEISINRKVGDAYVTDETNLETVRDTIDNNDLNQRYFKRKNTVNPDGEMEKIVLTEM
ncbi:MAG: hypothetical protein N4A47_00165 [Clostridia bacterium]|jgi:hypothetical protein|nr:hypothetical protein [Clostridia bacterium]